MAEATPDKPKEQTTVTAPPKQTEMVAKKVKIKLKRDAYIGDHRDPFAAAGVRLAGETVEVSEQQADELCRPIKGGFGFRGTREIEDTLHVDLTRAVRV